MSDAEMMAEFREGIRAVLSLQAEMRGFRETLDSLVKVVRGNGTPSLITSVAVADKEIQHLQSESTAVWQRVGELEVRIDRKLQDLLSSAMTEMRAADKDNQDSLNSFKTTVTDDKKHNSTNSILIWTLVVVGLLSFLASCIALFGVFFK